MDRVYIKLTVSGLPTFHSLVNERQKYGEAIAVCISTLKDLRRCCSPIRGHNILRIFRNFQPVLENHCCTFSPDPTDVPWVSEDGMSDEQKKKTKEKLTKVYFAALIQSRALRSKMTTIYFSLSLFAAFWKRVSLNHQYNFFFLMESVNAGRLNLLPLKPAYLRIIF